MTPSPNDLLAIRPDVAAALAAGAPVVALESTVIAHGLPHPANVESALALEAAVRDEGALPATIAVLDGRLRVGLTADEIRHLGTAPQVAKVSRRDLAAVITGGGPGATTVAATMIAARLAGIRLFATGGIGGVHRGAETSFDVSADLDELARTPVAVVSAGAKAILDLAKTREVLETRGVPVIGYGTDALPAFWLRDSGLPVDARVDDPAAAARLLAAHWALGLDSGLLVANPVPAEVALDADTVTAAVDAALAAAQAAGVTGKAVTPFLLDRVAQATRGWSVQANRALLDGNARLAARIAVALAAP
ncbi:MAG: pseudouridine-5'-phosphate glycosidase [Rhodobacterales bacterium]|nr:pseudouridine-5'-phosphate glycosidase [Rhodobacterales bacterium]